MKTKIGILLLGLIVMIAVPTQAKDRTPMAQEYIIHTDMISLSQAPIEIANHTVMNFGELVAVGETISMPFTLIAEEAVHRIRTDQPDKLINKKDTPTVKRLKTIALIRKVLKHPSNI